MNTSAKLVLAALGSAVLLGGCATGPYYDRYGYDQGYGGYGYSDYPYAAPGVGLGFSYSDSDRSYRHRDDRDDRDGRWRDRRDHNDRGNWRENRGEWRDSGRDARDARATDWDIRNNSGVPLWSQGNTYRGVGPNYDPAKDVGQYSGG